MRKETHMSLGAIRVMIDDMIRVQRRLNEKADGVDWKDSNHDWGLALLVESVELIDAFDWKWWKAGESNVTQAKMEAVDVFHFLLSALMQYSSSDSALGDSMMRAIEEWLAMGRDGSWPVFGVTGELLPGTHDDHTVIARVRELVGVITATEHTPPATVVRLLAYLSVLQALHLSFVELYKLYIGKAQLNELRWANGYGTTYVKSWHGVDDSDVLSEVLSTLPIGLTFAADVHRELARRYSAVVAATQS